MKCAGISLDVLARKGKTAIQNKIVEYTKVVISIRNTEKQLSWDGMCKL